MSLHEPGLTKAHGNVVVAPTFMVGVTVGVKPNATTWMGRGGFLSEGAFAGHNIENSLCLPLTLMMILLDVVVHYRNTARRGQRLHAFT